MRCCSPLAEMSAKLQRFQPRPYSARIRPLTCLRGAMPILTEAQVEQFRRDGYLHVKGLVPAAEIAELGAEVDRAVAHRTQFDERGQDEKSPFEQSFTMCQSVW